MRSHALDELPCAVLVTDSTGRILVANSTVAEWAGGTVADWEQRELQDMFPPATRIFSQTHVWPTLLRDGRVSELQIQILDAQQRRIPVLLNCHEGKREGRSVYYWTLFQSKDRQRFEGELIAARNRAEAAVRELSESQRFIKTITDAIPGLVGYWDLEQRCRFANRAYLEWFGKRPDEVLGLTLRELLGEHVYGLDEQHIQAALHGESRQFTRTLTKADGALAHALASYIPDWVDGKVQGFFVTVSDVTRLKDSETALRAELLENERILGRLSDTSAALHQAQRLGKTGSWQWRISGDIVTWSPQMFEILGCDPGRPPPSFAEQAKLYEPHHFQALQQAVGHALRTGEPYVLELQYVGSSGQGGWLEARGEVHQSDAQELIGLRGTVQDISLRKAQEQSLLEARERLKAMYESTPAMLHSIDTQGRLLHVSDTWLTRLGYVREEVIGRHSSDFMTEASRRFARSVVQPEFFTTGYCEEVPYQMVTRDGKLVDVLLSAVLETQPAGGEPRSLAVIQDVTARRQAERELAKERERLRNLIDSTHAGTWEWNVQTGEVIVNERWATIIGWTHAELGAVTNQFRVDMAHPEELPQTRQLLRDHFAGRSPSYMAEVRLRRRDGEWIWVEDRGRLITRTPDGRPEWMFGVQMDISERKQREDALRRSEQFLHRTGEVSGVGGWELDLVSGALVWSAQTRRLHGVADDFVPTLEAATEFYAAEARPLLEAAVKSAIETGQGWDLQLPLIRADGRVIQARAVGEVEFDGDRPKRLLGTFQDVTDEVAQRKALQAAHQRISLATDSGGIGVWDIDLATNRLTVDAWMIRLYNLPRGEESDPQALWSRHVHPEDRDKIATDVQTAIAGRKTLETEFRIIWANGSIHHMKVSARLERDDRGRALRMIGVSWDVTALRQMSAELAEQHELLRVTLQSIGDAVITTDSSGLVTWLNPTAERMTGWLTREAIGLPLAQVFHIINEETRLPAENPVAACLSQDKVVGLANHTVLISRDGSEFGIEDSAAPIRNPQGAVLGVVLVFHDVSEQRRLSGEMTYRATHDALTGLVNRAEFEARLLRSLRSAHDHDNHHVLLFIDLDQFKLVNDSCGHAAGDELLQQMSKILREAIRERDTLARLGGDEFAILLEHCSAEQAFRIGQKICDRMDVFRFVRGEQRFRVGTSIGLVPIDKRWASTAAIQLAADSSCYAAKEAGRNRVHAWFDSDVAMMARQHEIQWTTRIEHALDEGGFDLFAQRIEALDRTSSGLHAEVLLRMKNADGSHVLPGAFLPAAERFHLVTRVDRWVLQHVLAWMTQWADQRQIETLSVNLSGQSIGDGAFHDWAREQLAAAGPSLCSKLCLEITETAAVTNLADAAIFIDQVRALGVKVALDDFGAGASSFAYLKSLRIDILKIDGQFVRHLQSDPLDAAAVRCFADVARVIGVETVAEFVDSPQALERLREIGVNYAQGFLIHRPEPIDALLVVAAGAAS